MNTQFASWLRGRWDWLGIVAAGLSLQLLSRTSGAYFLHFDTPTQDVAALEWVRGCWGYSTSKVLPIVLLGPFYWLFGPSAIWETLLLLGGAAVSLLIAYELTLLISGRRPVAGLAALLLAALPAFQYFSRTHLGYPMPFMLLGWLAAWHKRWFWVGLFFGLAITAHYNSWVPVGLSLGGLAVLYLRPSVWKQWLGLVIGLAIPLLAIDALFYFYTGIPFNWNQGVFAEVTRLAVLDAGAPHSNWGWLWQTLIASNGWGLTLLLTVGLSAPFVIWRRDKTGAAMLATFIGLAGLYTLQAGLGRALLVSRILATSYPFWAIGSALVIGVGLDWLRSARQQPTVLAVIYIALIGVVLQTGYYITAFTQTPYPQIDTAMVLAAQQDRPVRYLGNYWIPSFYAQVNGLEMLTGDDRWLTAGTPGQAVLFFEGQSPAGLDQEDYTIRIAQVDNTLDDWFPGLTEEATLLRRVEIWQPGGPSQPIGRPGDPLPYSVYFDGSGCVTLPAYGDHHLHFYQLAWQKLLQRLGLAR